MFVDLYITMECAGMDKNQGFSGKIESIQLIRAIAAIGVAVYHIQFMYATGLDFAFGVHLFFTISAFLLMYTTQKKRKQFVLKRMLRIIPLYWIMTFGTYFVAKGLPALMPQTQADGKSLLFSLFFIPYARDGLRAENMIRPLVGPAWTLNYEVLVTLVFAAAMRISHKYRGIITAMVLGILLFIGRTMEINNTILYFWSAPYMADFITGFLSFYILREVNKLTIHKNMKSGLGIAAIVACCLMCWNGYPQPRWVVNSLLSAFVLIAFVVSLNGVRIPRLACFAGDISFSFYLIHYYVIIIIGKLISLNSISILSVLGLFAVILVSGLLAYVSYELIEKRFTIKVIGMMQKIWK